MTLDNDLAYFAAHCPDSEIDSRLPKAMGALRDMLIKHKLIPAGAKDMAIEHSFDSRAVAQLRCILRFEYAVDMKRAMVLVTRVLAPESRT